MSQYRAYFVPRSVDPSGSYILGPDRTPFDQSGGDQLPSLLTENPDLFTSGLPSGPAYPWPEYGGPDDSQSEFCISLLKNLRNTLNDIKSRLEALRLNLGPKLPGGGRGAPLPERAPGDVLKPRLSKWGHRKIINQLKADLAQKEVEYFIKCGGGRFPPIPVLEPELKPCPKPVISPEMERALKKLSLELQLGPVPAPIAPAGAGFSWLLKGAGGVVPKVAPIWRWRLVPGF
jgi:hypothetical protein